MNSAESTSRNIAWPWIIGATGGLLFLLGAGRFAVRHHFGLTDVFYCFLAVVPAGLLLLVITYVVQHAILVSVIPLVAAGILIVSSPVFDIALGLALMGIVAESTMSDRKCEKSLRRYNDESNGENNISK